MRDKNPEMVSGKQKKFVMRPPQVVRVGSKKTAFANFIEIAKMLHRQPKHLLQFLFAGRQQININFVLPILYQSWEPVELLTVTIS